jgi:endonuclease/exonuclease/phosphatase family metal-dependent hydrolase
MSIPILEPGASLDAALSSPAHGLSVLSYNVLLPNGAGNGWWVDKYYECSVPQEHRAWPHRRALLRRELLGATADVLCLQETTPETFEQDWSFLAEAGYDHALHRKGELRCATFWRRDRWSLLEPPRHQDRTLLTTLGSLHSSRYLTVVNVHLKAGAEPARRLRQVDEALAQIERRCVARGARPEELPVVICGDFNCDVHRSAAGRLLRQGEVTPDFREASFPDLELTSRPRKTRLGPFRDVYLEAFGEASPPTLLLPDRRSFFFSPDGGLSPAYRAAVRALFLRFARGRPSLDRSAVDAWITTINGEALRGSERDKAEGLLAGRGEEGLREEDLQAIYEAELLEGKPWGVLHDLIWCGALAEAPPARVQAYRFDQIHATGSLEVAAVRRPESEGWFRRGVTLPDGEHPSDHLPVGAVLRWR